MFLKAGKKGKKVVAAVGINQEAYLAAQDVDSPNKRWRLAETSIGACINEFAPTAGRELYTNVLVGTLNQEGPFIDAGCPDFDGGAGAHVRSFDSIRVGNNNNFTMEVLIHSDFEGVVWGHIRGGLPAIGLRVISGIPILQFVENVGPAFGFTLVGSASLVAGWNYLAFSVGEDEGNADVEMQLNDAVIASKSDRPFTTNTNFYHFAQYKIGGSIEQGDGRLAIMTYYPSALTSLQKSNHFDATGF